MFKRIGQSQNKYFYLLVVLFLLAELIILPFDNFPLNDDWVYAKTLRDLFLGRPYNLGTSNCTLWTQVMWGLLFTKVFGFSFGVLRLCTFISALAAVWFLFRLILKITNDQRLAFLSGFVLLFNPFFFNLSHTFMTDVHFTALLILCCFLCYKFYQSPKLWLMSLLMILALLLVLIRQFGIIIPLCFTFSCLFLKEKKWKYFFSSILLTLIVFSVYSYYEHFLKVNGRAEMYPFSSRFSLTDGGFWKMLGSNFLLRYTHIIIQISVYTLPIVVIYLPDLLKTSKWFISLSFSVLSSAIVFYLLKDTWFPLGNIFVNANLGAETFYEWLNTNVRPEHGHTYLATFEVIIYWVKIVSSMLLLTTVFLTLFVVVRKLARFKDLFTAPHVFFGALVLSYAALLIVADGFFDRYHLPLVVLVIILAAFVVRVVQASPAIAWVLLVPLFYVSVFGTKDYFELNRKRWEAYNYLRFEKGVPNKKINAGYEVDGWNDGDFMVYYKGTFVHDVDYLIEYTQVPEFKPYREYEFQRYFPYKKDKIFIFVREQKLK